MDLNNIDISKLPADVRKEYRRYQVLHAEKKIQNRAQDDFLSFVKCVWPEFIEGSHHRHIAKKFNKLATGEITRLIVNMPPRHTKSEFASYLLPAWMVGRNPKLKIIQATHTGELAIRFGRKAKHLIDSQEYAKIFKTKLQEDSKAAGRWETAQGGEYFAAGVGGAITGRGADLLIIDDPHSEQDALSETSLENAYEWYTSGPRQRLQPGGKIILVMTRWSTKDLTGILLKKQGAIKADEWEVVEFPAILDEDSKNPKSVWPEYWNIEELEKVKATLPVAKWNAQWMQKPTSEEGALIKREWWRKWDKDYVPPLQHVIQSYDTAFLKKETADFSAITTWGVFTPNDDSGPNLILLDCIKGRWEFPELRRRALANYKYWDLIEAKAAGLPLTYELRAMDIPVVNFTPSKGNDKHARVNSVAPLFESGMIWAPTQKFADEVIEECAAFPHGDHDDLVDSMTQAVMRFRQGGLIRHPEDYKDPKKVDQKQVYYG
jgi:predicted phage terminase large subunit-like protein